MSETFWLSSDSWDGGRGLLLASSGQSASRDVMSFLIHRTAPHNKELSGLNCQQHREVEKLSTKQTGAGGSQEGHSTGTDLGLWKGNKVALSQQMLGKYSCNTEIPGVLYCIPCARVRIISRLNLQAGPIGNLSPTEMKVLVAPFGRELSQLWCEPKTGKTWIQRYDRVKLALPRHTTGH